MRLVKGQHMARDPKGRGEMRLVKGQHMAQEPKGRGEMRLVKGQHMGSQGQGWGVHQEALRMESIVSKQCLGLKNTAFMATNCRHMPKFPTTQENG
jgi:hypothetical protein